MSGRGSTDRVSAFVVCTPGLEPLTLAEVARLGVANPKAVPGGVACTATWPQVWALNLHLRTATRVLVRVARFDADGFDSLIRGLRRVDWSVWFPADTALSVSASSSGSKLFHTDAVIERVMAVVPHGEMDGGGPPVDLLVRIVGNAVTLSLNSSGDALHRRGWRVEVGKAPMRETLAAALIMASGWDGKAPLVDPFCGSGTIPIEAMMMARRMPPGRHRSFGFTHWPSFDEARWKRLLDGADADVLARVGILIGSDRDEGVINAARGNAQRAGVAEAVSFEHRPVSSMTAPSGRPGWVVTNPPYGHRVGDDDLRNLYDRFSSVLTARFAGWRLGVVIGESSPRLRVGLDDQVEVRTSNGGLPIAFRSGRISSAAPARPAGATSVT